MKKKKATLYINRLVNEILDIHDTYLEYIMPSIYKTLIEYIYTDQFKDESHMRALIEFGESFCCGEYKTYFIKGLPIPFNVKKYAIKNQKKYYTFGRESAILSIACLIVLKKDVDFNTAEAEAQEIIPKELPEELYAKNLFDGNIIGLYYKYRPSTFYKVHINGKDSIDSNDDSLDSED